MRHTNRSGSECTSGRSYFTEGECQDVCVNRRTYQLARNRAISFCCRKNPGPPTCDGRIADTSDVSHVCDGRVGYAAPNECLRRCAADRNEHACFVCQHAEEPACAAIRGPTTLPSGTVISAELRCRSYISRNGANDCYWRDGSCIDRFTAICQDRAAVKDVDQVFIATEGPAALGRLDLRRCTSIDYLFIGHSERDRVNDPFQVVEGCMRRAPSCSNINVLNMGCRTFADQGAALRLAQNLRRTVPRGVTVTVTGNQAVAEPVRSLTHLTFDITCDGVRRTLPACHETDTYCTGHFDVAQCTDSRGRDREEVCCRTSRSPGRGVWRPGNRCPGRRDTDGTCEVVGRGARCEPDALADANRLGNICLRERKDGCQAKMGEFTVNRATARETSRSGAAICEVTGTFTYTCKSHDP